MTALARKISDPAVSILSRPVVNLPLFAATSIDTIALRCKTSINIAGEELELNEGTLVDVVSPLVVGGDHTVLVDAANRLIVDAWKADETRPVLGGFHYAPGGNSPAREGGDSVPAINPSSIWDIGFRPACNDPRGMALVAIAPGSEDLAPFWVDLYLLNVDHLQLGTSDFGATIADGYKNRPKGADGKPVEALDYATAKAIMEGHGKGLLSLVEFFAAAYGVTEKTAAGDKPKQAGLDAARTSRFGVMQATGNLYVWGHDGDPDSPRASLFGGDWDDGDWAGSRQADVGFWPGNSSEWIGARGRSDHLQLDA